VGGRIKTRIPKSYAESGTRMMLVVSLNLIAFARAFSSEMWLTPKN
jgi:hypothetical protein